MKTILAKYISKKRMDFITSIAIGACTFSEKSITHKKQKSGNTLISAYAAAMKHNLLINI